MGLESAELRLLEALQAKPDGITLELRVVGGRAGRRHARSLRARWYPGRPWRVPRRAWRSADLVHLIGLDLRPPPPERPFVATIHDLAAMRFRDEGTLPVWTSDLVQRASRLLTPSRFTAHELQELLGVPPERIRVVANGPGQPVSPAVEPLSEDELAALGIRGPFFLRMGGHSKRKNVPLLLAAWPAVRRRTAACLALAGPPPQAENAARAASLDGVVVLDYLPAATMPRLIRAACAVVSTSTYEGFGLPPLESMAAGTPVVAVRSRAVEEVCATAAVLVENDPEALADSLVRVIEDAALRQQLVEAGLRRAECFSWERAADALLAVYRELDGGPVAASDDAVPRSGHE